MIKVALIDDGVCFCQYRSILYIKQYIVRNGFLRRDKTQYDSATHATFCAAVIDKYAKHEIELISINIMNFRKNGNVQDLIAAIKWCCNNNIPIINMSCGTTDINDGQRIERAISTNSATDSILIAAQSNAMLYTYPACLPNVIGVRTDPSLFNCRYRINFQDRDGIDINAASIHSIIVGEKKIITKPCNSFASAMLCALVTNLVVENCIASKDAAIQLLKEQLFNVRGTI